ncbi:hypothetical protein EV714DRAFT_240519 [Schizophyllum commune]
MSPPIPRILTLPQAALDAFMARSHMLGQLACRILGVAIGLVGLKNAKPMSIVPRSAPAPLGDRCEACSNRVGGHGFRARSSAERCCASYFSDRLEDHNNAKLASNAPRPAPVPLAEGCDGWVRGQTGGMGSLCGAARSAAAFLCLKSARELLDDGLDCGDGAGSGAKRRYRCVFDSRQLHGQNFTKSTSNAPRLAPSVLVERLDDMGGGEDSAERCRERSHLIQYLHSDSEATYRRPASKKPTETAIQPPFSSHFSAQGAPSPATLGDEYMYLSAERGPFPSLSEFTFDCATLFEPPASLATPSILVSTYFIISQPLGTAITFVSSRHRISRASFLRAHGSRTH